MNIRPAIAALALVAAAAPVAVAGTAIRRRRRRRTPWLVQRLHRLEAQGQARRRPPRGRGRGGQQPQRPELALADGPRRLASPPAARPPRTRPAARSRWSAGWSTGAAPTRSCSGPATPAPARSAAASSASDPAPHRRRPILSAPDARPREGAPVALGQEPGRAVPGRRRPDRGPHRPRHLGPQRPRGQRGGDHRCPGHHRDPGALRGRAGDPAWPRRGGRRRRSTGSTGGTCSTGCSCGDVRRTSPGPATGPSCGRTRTQADR